MIKISTVGLKPLISEASITPGLSPGLLNKTKYLFKINSQNLKQYDRRKFSTVIHYYQLTTN